MRAIKLAAGSVGVLAVVAVAGGGRMGSLAADSGLKAEAAPPMRTENLHVPGGYPDDL